MIFTSATVILTIRHWSFHIRFHALSTISSNFDIFRPADKFLNSSSLFDSHHTKAHDFYIIFSPYTCFNVLNMAVGFP
jgi:hypothetical protein